MSQRQKVIIPTYGRSLDPQRLLPPLHDHRLPQTAHIFQPPADDVIMSLVSSYLAVRSARVCSPAPSQALGSFRWRQRRCLSSKTPSQIFGNSGAAEFLNAAGSPESLPKLSGRPEVRFRSFHARTISLKICRSLSQACVFTQDH